MQKSRPSDRGAKSPGPRFSKPAMEKYQSLQRDWDEFFEELGEMSANVKEQDHEQVDKLVDEAVRAARKSKAEK